MSFIEIPWKQRPPLGVPLDPAKAQSIIVYYAFNESGGDRAEDLSGNRNLGAWNGTGDHWVGGAAGFNGANDWINGGNISALNTATVLSFSAVVTLADVGSDHYIIENNNVFAGGGFLFFMDNVSAVSSRTDIFRIIVYDDTDGTEATLETPSGTAIAGKETHLVGIIDLDTDNLRLYVDGIEVPDSPVDISSIASIDAGAAPFAVGTHQDDPGGRWFGGSMDQVIVLAKSLNDSEIAQLAANPWHLHEPMQIPIGVAVGVGVVPQIQFLRMHTL